MKHNIKRVVARKKLSDGLEAPLTAKQGFIQYPAHGRITFETDGFSGRRIINGRVMPHMH